MKTSKTTTTPKTKRTKNRHQSDGSIVGAASTTTTGTCTNTILVDSVVKSFPSNSDEIGSGGRGGKNEKHNAISSLLTHYGSEMDIQNGIGVRTGSDSSGKGAAVDDDDGGDSADVTLFFGTLLDQTGLAIHMLSFLPPKNLARYRSVSKEFNKLCQAAIQNQPKKAFESKRELWTAVIWYCKDVTVTIDAKSERNKIDCIYSSVINKWNVSKVTDFSYVFADMVYFNEPINEWDLSNSRSMSSMFQNAKSFNQPLDSWDTSKVVDMSCMFDGAKSFNQPLNSWDTSKASDMEFMFRYAKSFNQPLDSWDTSQVAYAQDMFDGAYSYTHNRWL